LFTLQCSSRSVLCILADLPELFPPCGGYSASAQIMAVPISVLFLRGRSATGTTCPPNLRFSVKSLFPRAIALPFFLCSTLRVRLQEEHRSSSFSDPREFSKWRSSTRASVWAFYAVPSPIHLPLFLSISRRSRPTFSP